MFPSVKRGLGAGRTLLALALASAGSPACAPGAAEADAFAYYRVESGGRCSTTLLRVEVLRETDGPPGAWVRLSAGDDERHRFTVEMRVPSLAVLGERAAESLDGIERYVLRSAGREALEYRDRAAGRALLPRFSFAELLPRVASGPALEAPLLERGTYLGWPIRRVPSSVGRGVFPPELFASAPGADSRVLEIDTDLLIGTSVSRRDDGRPRAAGLGGDYRYVDLAEDDYRAMREAGFNVFRVPRAHLDFVRDEAVWFATTERLRETPDLLYRSNFFGCVLYMDEPAARALNRGMFRDFRDPRDPARILTEITRGRWEADYGKRLLPRLLGFEGFGVERCGIVQDDYPVWDAIESAAWYQLEAGVPGWCYEARLDAEAWADLVRSRLGVEFPRDVDRCLRFHYALFTGAARRFEARWGVSVYGQMEPTAADRAFPVAWDLGASYFWLWSTDRGHHVPFPRQLELARALRRHAERNPRTETARMRTAGTRTAVALPWGYACDQFALGVYAAEGKLWGSDHLGLDARNPEGATYAEVLAAFVRRCVRLLESGERYDVVFWRPEERGTGYDRVYRILATGEERVETGNP